MPQGFFTKQETESVTRPNGKRYSCASCGLYRNGDHSKIPPFGNFRKGILNIGEALGEQESRVGKPWQGRAGKLLQRTYAELGIDLFEDCLNINSCNCRPVDDKGNNRAPTNYEIECCRQSNLKVIEEYAPRVIVLLGNAAVYSLIGMRWKKDLEGITKWRGWTIPDLESGAWICPTFHPSFIERSEIGAEKTIWMQDLSQAFAMVDVPVPKYREPKIHYIEKLDVLDQIKSDTISFDYETNGLKPQAVGHKIVCCSVAISANEVYVFMMPKSKEKRKPFTDLLKNNLIGKCAHNMKFEHTWSLVKLKTEVKNWQYDSMLASHLLDNRQSITSLKFQAFVLLGADDYSSEIEPYLKSGSKNGNAFNRIEELIETAEGKRRLLTYCALDSIYEFRISQIQQKIMDFQFLPF